MRHLSLVLMLTTLAVTGHCWHQKHWPQVLLGGVGLQTTAGDMRQLGFANRLEQGTESWVLRGTVATGQPGAFVTVMSDRFTVNGVAITRGDSVASVLLALGPPAYRWDSERYWAYPRLNLHVRVSGEKVTGALLMGEES